MALTDCRDLLVCDDADREMAKTDRKDLVVCDCVDR